MKKIKRQVITIKFIPILLLILALILSLSSVSATDASNNTSSEADAKLMNVNVPNTSSEADAKLMNVSVPFVENHGQTDPQVSYYAKTFYGTSYVTHDGITHQIFGPNNKTLVIKEHFLDKNGNIITFRAQGEGASSATVSYFIGNDPNNWQTNLSTYNIINLGELYPGITVKLRATGSNIEKLYYVSPGANTDNIKIQILGADQLQTDETGNLIIKSNGFENVSMSKPLAFQDKKNIESNYHITGNTYGFQIGNYDHNKNLIIDPVLQYSTYLGGTSDEFGLDIAVDNDGNAYIIGFTVSPNFPTTPGAFQTTHGGSYDVFVSKINPTGTALVYSTYLGGSEFDWGWGIAVDNDGNAYITGYTESLNFPITSGAFQSTLNRKYDVFITKLNPTGTALVYSTYLGGTSDDWGTDIVVDNDSNAYITGYTVSPNFPTTPGAFQTISGGDYEVFISKINPTGTALVYSTYLGGTARDEGFGIAVDNDGNAYIGGRTWSSNFPTTPGAFQTLFGGDADAFVSKINPTGTALVYSNYLGGTSIEYGFGIAVDIIGNAYITGVTVSPNFPTTPGAFQTLFGGGDDVFVSKINPTGTALVYSTYLGGTGFDTGWGIVVDIIGNAYITGVTVSPNFPTTPGAFQTLFGGDADVVVSKINPTGTALVYSTYLGGTGFEGANDVAVDNIGNVYITGAAGGTDLPTTPETFQNTFAGGYRDAFVAKFSQCANVTISKTGNGPLNVGDMGTFTITLHNVGPDAAHNVAVVDLDVPAGWTVTPSSGTSWDLNTHTWTVGTLNSGDEATLTISGTITTAMAGTTITNTATETQDELNQETQTASASIIVNPMANVTISKTGNGPLNVGDMGTFTLTLHNVGPDAAHNVAVVDLDVPAGWTVTPSSGTSWDLNTHTWTVGTLNKGGDATLIITGIITTAMAGTTITNTVTETQDELNQETQIASASIIVNPMANVTLSKKADNYRPNAGETVVFTIVATNSGPNTANNLVVTDILPVGLDFVNCTNSGVWDPVTRTVTWPASTLAKGAKVTYYLTTRVNSTILAGKNLTNVVNETHTEYPSNVTVNCTLHVPKANLYIQITSNKNNPKVGEIFTITYKLGNYGPDDATNVTITIPIPDGFLISKIKGDGKWKIVGNNVIWTMSNVTVGDPYLYITGKPTQPGRYLFKASIASETFNINSVGVRSLSLNASQVKSASEKTSRTIGMQETGTPVSGIVLAILMVFGGFIGTRKKQ